ncbi:MAG: molybdopterin oxidoreductase [Planctomycetota bacterium]|nr:MAG: molybdopterin oxidoreductase [Planctomycetota bacterium]
MTQRERTERGTSVGEAILAGPGGERAAAPVPADHRAQGPPGDGLPSLAAGTEAGGAGAPAAGEQPGPPRYWLSLEAYEGAPGYRERIANEFPPGATELETTALSRRRFLQLLGASAALAGTAGCDILRRPVEKVVPYAERPEILLPGEPLYYATGYTRGGVTTGIVVKSADGRPIKVEGNPDHPASSGGTDVFMQASVLDVYDPDRSFRVLERGEPRAWADWDRFARRHFRELLRNGGEGLVVLAEPQGSPTLQWVRERLLEKMPRARWVAWEPLHRDQVYAGTRIAFGRPLEVLHRLEQAEVIVALDADFTFGGPDSVAALRAFARRRNRFEQQRRNPEAVSPSNRLYAVEPHYTPTSSLADHRLALPAGQVAGFLEALAGALLAEGLEVAGLPAALGKRLAQAAAEHPFPERWPRALARDLLRHRGRGLIVLGPRQPAHAHALAAALNRALGNDRPGGPVAYLPPLDPRAVAQSADLQALVADMQAGKVGTLVVLGGNPVYDAPADLGLAEALGKVPTVVRLGLYEDETSAVASWHLPRAHELESWGDGRALDGTACLIQPLIAPLYGGRSDLDLLVQIAALPETNAYRAVQSYWRTQRELPGEGEFEARWRRALHLGVLQGTALEPLVPALDWEAIARALPAASFLPPPSSERLEVAFERDPRVYDGRYANNAWLQELPDPITKLCWDNAALMSLGTAKALGLAAGDLVELELAGRRLEIAAWPVPGHADGAITLTLGYGRTRSGRLGTGVGFDTYRLRTAGAPWIAQGARVRRLGRRYELACTQDHHDVDVNRGSGHMHERPIVREVELAVLLGEGFQPQRDLRPPEAPVPRDPKTGQPLGSLWQEFDYSKGQQWGMAIDLNACNGCNACVIACQAENNIPIVGKREVIRGREMHWIRIDRYFSGHPFAPLMVNQPMPCQQCENAPCESVCPVGATSHSPDGLNDMVYNRCIGTRYCSNNCPFKVRRFNYFNFTWQMFEKGDPKPLPLVNNPDVTVRFRGVMEKCTYCVQRIRRAQHDAKIEGRDRVADGTFTSACAQACPADAIVFGDINDPGSRVSRIKASRRNYHLFPEMNLRTRTSYLARVRNPNPELEG